MTRWVCIDATGWPASLRRGAVYEELPAEPGDPPNMIRIVDDSGEDYLHEVGLFRPLEDTSS
jgi:hypothetical protein